MDNITDAETGAQFLANEYGLTYRAKVNLEAALNNAVADGLTIQNAMKFAEDILQHVEFRVLG